MVSLIIVDYRTIMKTLNYIEECRKAFMKDRDIHVIIVDNNGDEQEGLALIAQGWHADIKKLSIAEMTVPVYECICADGSIITYIAARENLGYAKGNDLGAKAARILFHDKYYLFSNNDLRFPEQFDINTLISPMLASRSIAVVGPCILSVGGEKQSPRKKSMVGIGLFAYYWDMLLPKGFKFDKRISDVDVDAKSGTCDWVTGSFLIADAEKFDHVGGFDEHTFLFYEEVILAERLRKMNYAMYYTDVIKIVHEHGETVKSAFSIIKGIDISFASAIYYFRKYRHISKPVIMLAYCNYYIFRILFRAKKAIGSLR